MIDSLGFQVQECFMSAINQGRAKAVQTLLEHGADSMAKDEFGRTPMQIARQRGKEENVRILKPSRSFYYAKDSMPPTPKVPGLSDRVSADDSGADSDREYAEGASRWRSKPRRNAAS